MPSSLSPFSLLPDSQRSRDPTSSLIFLVGHVSFFCFPSGIGEVTAKMAHWNKVSSTSNYLEGVQFGVNEGHVRVGVTNMLVLFGSWQLVYLSREAIDWLLALRLQPLHSFCSMTRFSFYNSLDWW